MGICPDPNWIMRAAIKAGYHGSVGRSVADSMVFRTGVGFCLVLTSVPGTKRTCRDVRVGSTLGGKAEIGVGQTDPPCTGKAIGFAKGSTNPAICLGKIVEPIQQICLTGKSPKIPSIPSVKNILLFRNSNRTYILTIPSHRGALRNVNNAGGMHGRGGWRYDASTQSGRPSRVVLAPRRWSQAGWSDPPATVASKPGHREEHEATVTHCAGNAGRSGEPVVTNSCAYLHICT